jgi:hypothetical protein
VTYCAFLCVVVLFCRGSYICRIPAHGDGVYFRVLQNAVELRQAHWFWLTDLSSPDPLHILPIFIIITMCLIQFITPSPGMDLTQRRLFSFVASVVMGFTLWRYASGLALYWATGNLINLLISSGLTASGWARRCKPCPPSGRTQRHDRDIVEETELRERTRQSPIQYRDRCMALLPLVLPYFFHVHAVALKGDQLFVDLYPQTRSLRQV